VAHNALTRDVNGQLRTYQGGSPAGLEQDNGAGRIEWQNIDADGLPAEVKKSFDTMVEAEAAFNASCSPCAWFWI